MQSLPIAATWFLSVVLVEAAIIDGWKLKVPNWLTFHLAAGGVALAFWQGGTPGAIYSIAGLCLGLALLLPLYAVGGMGAGDVKLLAGVGAWCGPTHVLGAFVATALVGGVMAFVMVLASGRLSHHLAQGRRIATDIATVRDPSVLAEQAAARKPNMLLLPYGIPMAIGSILYFAWAGLLS